MSFDLCTCFTFVDDIRRNPWLKYRVRKYGNQILGLEYQISDEPAGRPVTKKSAGALYDLYEPAAERHATTDGEKDGAGCNQKRDSRAPYCAAERITSQLIGAHDVTCRRPAQRAGGNSCPASSPVTKHWKAWTPTKTGVLTARRFAAPVTAHV